MGTCQNHYAWPYTQQFSGNVNHFQPAPVISLQSADLLDRSHFILAWSIKQDEDSEHGRTLGEDENAEKGIHKVSVPQCAMYSVCLYIMAKSVGGPNIPNGFIPP